MALTWTPWILITALPPVSFEPGVGLFPFRGLSRPFCTMDACGED